MDKTEEPDLFFKVAVTLARGKIKSKYVGEKISSISFEEFEKILNDDARHDDLMAKLEADFERKFEKIFGTEFEALFKTEYDAMLRAKPKKGCEPEFGPAFQEKLRQMFGQEFETNLQNHNFTIRSALQTLGLDPTKVHTKVEIKQKFKAMCLETHPDKNPGASANAFNAVMEAHNFLKEQMERQGLEQISA
ncbi:MAG: J domain-containing protein [Chlamydiales bacterium]|nr:J domain-containing protein [Chlamydiales bacterium]